MELINGEKIYVLKITGKELEDLLDVLNISKFEEEIYGKKADGLYSKLFEFRQIAK